MKKRNPLAVFVLSIITLGIYDLYWLVVTRRELNEKTNQRIPSIWLLFAPIAGIVLVTLLQAVMHSASPNPGTANASVNILSIIVALLAFLVVLPISFYWFLKYSKAANEYTNGACGTGLAFVLLWLLQFIGVAVVQDYYNDVIGGSGQPAAPIQPTAAPQQPIITPPSQQGPNEQGPMQPPSIH